MKKRKIYDFLYIIIGLPWFFLMLFSSNLYTGIKVSLLGALIVICVGEILGRHLPFKKKYLKFVSFFIIYALFSLSLGIFNGYEFVLSKDYSLLQNNILTPLCILIITTVMSSEEYRKEYIWKLLLWLTCLMTVLDVIKVASFMFGLNLPFLNFIMIYSEEISVKLALRVTNESSLMFLLPIYIFLLINPGHADKKSKLLFLVTSFMGVLYTIISGRKILELSLALAFFFSIIFVNGKFNLSVLFTPKKIRYYFVGFLASVILLIVFEKLSANSGLDILDLAYEQISRGFSSDADGVEKRFGTTSALINMWLNSPLWGNGLNAYAPNYLANETTMWSYEVVYIALLAQTGIIGVMLFAIPAIFIIKRLWMIGKAKDDNRYFGLAFGFAVFIFCGSSNPLVFFVWPWSVSLTLITSRFSKQNVVKIANENIL